jgi:hypothetical protein
MNPIDEHTFDKQYEILEVLGLEKSVINKFMLVTKDVANIINTDAINRINKAIGIIINKDVITNKDVINYKIDNSVIDDYVDIIKKYNLSKRIMDIKLCLVLLESPMCSTEAAKYIIEQIGVESIGSFSIIVNNKDYHIYERAKDIIFDYICTHYTYNIKFLLQIFVDYKIKSTKGLIKLIDNLNYDNKKEIIIQILEKKDTENLLLSICKHCSRSHINEIMQINTLYYRFKKGNLQLAGRTLDSNDSRDIEYVSNMIKNISQNKNYTNSDGLVHVFIFICVFIACFLLYVLIHNKKFSE